MQISLEPFDSQPTGVVATLNEDYLFESNSSLPITWMHPFCWICPSALHQAPLLHRVLDILSNRFLPVFGTFDTGKVWHSQVCPRAIGGINTCHKMRHSLSLPTVTHIAVHYVYNNCSAPHMFRHHSCVNLVVVPH